MLFGINNPSVFPGWYFPALLVVGLWELIWKGFALWYSSKRNQTAWFVCILVLNTVGILPIIYLLIYKPWKEKSGKTNVKPKKKNKKA